MQGLEKRRLYDGETGLFVVVEGPDGSGKGQAERALIEYEQKLERAVLDVVAFSRANRNGLPELKDFWDPPHIHYNTLYTAEPTYEGLGQNIREEIVANNGRIYPAKIQTQVYGINRLVQMKRVTVPANEHNINVVQGRCCATSICYQPLIAEDERKDPEAMRKYVLNHEGNRFQLEHAPDLLLILFVNDEKELVRRLKARAGTSKDDNSIFDSARFQSRANKYYQSEQLREIFESRGTKVAYIDAGISEQATRAQAVEAYQRFLKG